MCGHHWELMLMMSPWAFFRSHDVFPKGKVAKGRQCESDSGRRSFTIARLNSHTGHRTISTHEEKEMGPRKEHFLSMNPSIWLSPEFFEKTIPPDVEHASPLFSYLHGDLFVIVCGCITFVIFNLTCVLGFHMIFLVDILKTTGYFKSWLL